MATQAAGAARDLPTRERLLRAGLAEFARHGYAGARIVRIADAAGANRERLYHHFGDKAGLFRACLSEALRRIAEAEPFAADDLGAYVAAMVEFHRREPDVLGILLAEAMSGRAPDAAERRERDAHYARRVAAVRDAQAAGAVAPELDPRVVVYAVLALVVAAELLPQLTEAILGAAGTPPPALEPELRRLFAALAPAQRAGGAGRAGGGV